jgi:hypothetical protein
LRLAQDTGQHLLAYLFAHCFKSPHKTFFGVFMMQQQAATSTIAAEALLQAAARNVWPTAAYQTGQKQGANN